MDMRALPGYGLTENRVRELYAVKHLRHLGEYGAGGFVAPSNRAPTNMTDIAHANTLSAAFFDCLDLVDDATLSFMIHELGLYSLQELPDLQVMFGNSSSKKSPFPQTAQRQRRLHLRQ